MSGTAEAATSAALSVPKDVQSTRVLDVAAQFMIFAERDGIEMTVAKMHFLCAQVQGWTLACSGKPAFAETIYAEPAGYWIKEIRDAFAPFGDGVFTLQDAIDAGIITMPRTSPEPRPAG